MWQHFLQNWNGVSLFLDTQATSPPELQLYTDASGSLGYEGFLAGDWFQGHWLPHTPSAKKGVLVLNGRSFFPYTWLVFYGVRTGLAKESACGVYLVAVQDLHRELNFPLTKRLLSGLTIFLLPFQFSIPFTPTA